MYIGNILFFINNITYYYITFLFLNSLLHSFFMGVLYCDSIDETISRMGDTVDVNRIESVENLSSNDYTDRIEPTSGIIVKYRYILKRKLHWYFFGKSSGNFNSYQDYKASWDPSIKFRTEFKESFRTMWKNPLGDFRNTKVSAARDRAKTRELDRQLAMKQDDFRKRASQREAQKLYENIQRRK